jgi:hypothetical protein
MVTTQVPISLPYHPPLTIIEPSTLLCLLTLYLSFCGDVFSLRSRPGADDSFALVDMMCSYTPVMTGEFGGWLSRYHGSLFRLSQGAY